MSEFGADYWEGRYRAGEATSRHDASPSLLAEAAALPPGRALDAGCGRGADALWLADRGWQVLAVDVSDTALALAQQAPGAERVEWVQADLTTWTPGERSFDLLTSHYVHVSGPQEELFRRLASWVAPGGTLLVVGHAAHDHGHGHGQPAAAQVGLEQVTAVLPEEEWEVVVAEPRTHTVGRPDGTQARLDDVVVRARRRSSSDRPMTRALVLGGGGPVGIAWETGLAVGLARHGVDLAVADRIVGTSAGSVVGAQLAAGLDLAERAERVYTLPPAGSAVDRALAAEVDPQVGARMLQLFQALGALAEPGPVDAAPDPAMVELGRLAVQAEVGPEEAFLALFGELAGQEWPEQFACTAVDTATGRFTVWDRSSGIPLERGVASSCSVPFVFPPITIGAGRYMDGGMRSALNADVAAGCDAVLVVSVMADLPPGFELPVTVRERQSRTVHLDALRASGAQVELVMPGAELIEISGMGLHLMDASRGPAGYAAGLRQAEVEADRVKALWTT